MSYNVTGTDLSWTGGFISGSSNLANFCTVTSVSVSISGLEVTSLFPSNNQNFVSQNTYFTVNVSNTTFPGTGIQNVSLYINGTLNQTNTSKFKAVYNFSVTLPNGFWNYTFQAYDNLTTPQNTINGTLNFTVNPFTTNLVSFNTTSAETANESFTANITSNGTSITSGWLLYNGTTYPSTVTNTAGNNYNISTYFDLPSGYTGLNRSFNFVITIAGTNYSTTPQQQTVALTYFTLCNATYTNDFLNITFKDEVSDAYINASITSGSSFVYYLGSGLTNKTLSYNSAGVNNYNYTFCATPTTRTVNVVPNVLYKQGSDYPQRIWNPTFESYNSSVFERVLYLLSSADGIFVTFQVVNNAQEVLQGVTSNASRDVSGTNTLVGTGTTDSAGTITYWLNPDYLHTFYFVLAGYDSLVTSIFPTQTSYTVTMGGLGTNGTTYDHNRGIAYNITPTNTSLLNNTLYNFSFNLTTTYWLVQSFGFTLTDENGTILNASNSTSNGGLTSAYFNTSNYSQISMNYFWYVNGSFSNFTYTWFVYNNAGAGFGLNTFFSHLVSYVTSGDGLFGLDDFGLALVSFFLIFIGTGILSFKFGLTSPATIAGFMFFLTAFLNVGVDVIPTGVSALRFFPTVLVGIIFAGVLLKGAVDG